MANPTLFASAVVNTIIHALAFSMKLPHPMFGAVMIIGLTTSLLNHGLTNNLAKYGDRLAMALALVFDLLLAYQQHAYLAFVGLYLSVASYAISKLFDIAAFHVLSHIILSGVHTLLILGQTN